MATWYTHGKKCDKRWKTHRAEHCPACHETFSGTKTGDAHRVGEHGVTEGPERRRCLAPSEVLIKRGKRGTFGLKWNEDRQYWQEDDPSNPFRDVGTPLNSSAPPWDLWVDFNDIEPGGILASLIRHLTREVRAGDVITIGDFDSCLAQARVLDPGDPLGSNLVVVQLIEGTFKEER